MEETESDLVKSLKLIVRLQRFFRKILEKKKKEKIDQQNLINQASNLNTKKEEIEKTNHDLLKEYSVYEDPTLGSLQFLEDENDDKKTKNNFQIIKFSYFTQFSINFSQKNAFLNIILLRNVELKFVLKRKYFIVDFYLNFRNKFLNLRMKIYSIKDFELINQTNIWVCLTILMNSWIFEQNLETIQEENSHTFKIYPNSYLKFDDYNDFKEFTSVFTYLISNFFILRNKANGLCFELIDCENLKK